jgi:hypothetical protein
MYSNDLNICLWANYLTASTLLEKHHSGPHAYIPKSYFIFTSLVCCNSYETVPFKLLYGLIVFLVCYMFYEFIFVLYSHWKSLLLVTVLDAVIYTIFLLHVTLYIHRASTIIFSYRSTVGSLLPPTTRFITQYDHMPNIIYSFPSLLVVHIQEQLAAVLYFSIPNYCLYACLCAYVQFLTKN